MNYQGPEEPYTTVALGMTEVGKTHKNVQECLLYSQTIGNKHGRKVLILDFNNEAGYARFNSLRPTPENISKFATQKHIEVRRILGLNLDGSPMGPEEKCATLKMAIKNFRNGLIIADDIDKYAAHSNDKDLIGALMGNRHVGCDNIISHQSWRKMTVTEIENARMFRIHRTQDGPESLPAEKKFNFEACKIAHLIVEEQNKLAYTLYSERKITDQEFKKRRSFYVYYDTRYNKIFPCTLGAFQRAARKYFLLYPKAVKDEITNMIYQRQLDQRQAKQPYAFEAATERIIAELARTYLPSGSF